MIQGHFGWTESFLRRTNHLFHLPAEPFLILLATPPANAQKVSGGAAQ
jgi:hypothetical protein